MLWGKFLASISCIRKEENLSVEIRKEQIKPKEHKKEGEGRDERWENQQSQKVILWIG